MRNRTKLTALAVTAALVFAIGVGAVGGAVGHTGSPAVADDGQASADAFTVETERNPDPDSNLVTVRLAIEPTEATLTELEIVVERRAQSLVVPDSYTTTISPSNNAVEVDHAGGNEFTVDELEPGEQVVIEFQTVTTVSGDEAVDVAGIDVSYTRHGQRLSTDLTATGDTTTPTTDTKSGGVPLVQVSGVGVLAILLGLAGGVVIGRSGDDAAGRREEWVEAIEDIEPHVDDPIASSRLQQLRRRLSGGSDDLFDDTDPELGDGDEPTGSILDRIASVFGRSDDDSEDDEFDIEL
ncbi:hypothetical protein [Halopiger aswanensis]|uniref:Uncharacterized protein n=1 Tax=Halopiger aswanensis TaxID=148449 RepID=A0A419VW02_9EURY|nr:hypothetical protein [Halopiger aswanensis]RKD86236.1 hypothetical protein ATJ93_4653 [Halopiger aswanensis]